MGVKMSVIEKRQLKKIAELNKEIMILEEAKDRYYSDCTNQSAQISSLELANRELAVKRKEMEQQREKAIVAFEEIVKFKNNHIEQLEWEIKDWEFENQILKSKIITIRKYNWIILAISALSIAGGISLLVNECNSFFCR